MLLTSNLINYGARLGALLLPVPQVGKMSVSKLIYYFSSHAATFGFQASSPPDQDHSESWQEGLLVQLLIIIWAQGS